MEICSSDEHPQYATLSMTLTDFEQQFHPDKIPYEPWLPLEDSPLVVVSNNKQQVRTQLPFHPNSEN